RNRINRLAAANDAAEKLFGRADILDELASQATAQQVEDLRKRAARSRAAARRQERAAAEIEESLDTDDDERDRAIRQAARRGMAEALEEAEAIQNAIAAFVGEQNQLVWPLVFEQQTNSRQAPRTFRVVITAFELGAFPDVAGGFQLKPNGF